MEFIIICYFDH